MDSLVTVSKREFKVILHPDLEDGGYWVECPDLPGCSSQGDSVEEALDMIKDAIKGHPQVEEGLKGKKSPKRKAAYVNLDHLRPEKVIKTRERAG
ncbi:MAG: type II toxin-antitoxin system HicB family antitoxin [Thermodesulfobacteriota bacterium]